MEKNENKSVANKSIMMLLVVIIIALLAIGLIAWSRYRTTINGSASATSAQWTFKLTDADGTETQSFSLERTDENTSVADGVIAPGTYGKLEIGLDATGTQTALTYSIDASINDKPTNLKLYSDEDRTIELMETDGVLSKAGYMTLDEIGTRTETIYWEWPEETIAKPVIADEKLVELDIDTEEYNTLIAAKKFAEANDMIDTAESGKQVSMTVSVTAKQLIGDPTLADLVQVGDYVNYDASSNGTKTFTSSDCADLAGISISATISTDESFNSTAPAQWRVLSIDKETKTVELMSTEPTSQKIRISGNNGFINAETILNNIGAIYGQGFGATGGRSIKYEDIEKYSSFDKMTYENDDGIKYGNTQKYISGHFYVKKQDENGNIIYDSTVASDTNKIEMTQTSYAYNPQRYFSKAIYNMIFNNTEGFWIAERKVNLGLNSCSFNVGWGNKNNFCSRGVYGSNGDATSNPFNVVPVVSLKSDIKTTGKVGNVWQLKVD